MSKSNFVGDSRILDMQRILNGLMIVTPKAIAFVNFADGNVLPYFCEFNLLKDGPEIIRATVENRPQNVAIIFAQTNDG